MADDRLGVGEDDIDDVDVDMEEELEELRNKATKKRGRGLDEPQTKRLAHNYDSLADDGRGGPQRSVEGWIIFASNIHEETPEDDLRDKFAEFGNVKNLHFNLDRRTGYAKGYAIVQFETEKEAEAAIKALNGTMFLDQEMRVDWCFTRKAKSSKKR